MSPDVWISVLAGCLAVLVAGLVAGAAWRLARRRPEGPVLRPKALMNRPEAKLFRMLEHRLPAGYRLHAQVSYGAMFVLEDTAAWARINRRRADMVITDKAFEVLAVIEYQGAGHAGFTARSALRSRRADQIKRQALSDAGVRLVELRGEVSAKSVRGVLDEVFPAPTQSPPEIRRAAR